MKVSIIVFNYNGGTRLENCLAAVRALRAPEGVELERLLVDVDSGSGLAERMKDADPGLRLLSMPVRLGLTESLNQAARASAGRHLAFVQYQQVLHPAWLAACFEPFREAGDGGGPGAVCARGDDDLAGGLVWEAGDTSGRTERLSPAAGAMLVDREAFFECGEFDSDYYIAEENVDLGFRLWQQGRPVLQVSGDLARTSGPGAIGHYGEAEQRFFRARNRLFTVIKNYELESIYRILPALLVELFGEVWRGADLDPERYRFHRLASAGTGNEVKVSPEAAAGLLALDDLLGSFDRLRSTRRSVQAARRRSDREIFSRVAHPYGAAGDTPGHGADPELLARFRRLMAALEAEEGGGADGP